MRAIMIILVMTILGQSAQFGKADIACNCSLESTLADTQVQKSFTYYLSGFDKESRPILVMEIGKWPIKSFLENEAPMLPELDKHFEKMFQNLGANFRGIEANLSSESARGSVVIVDWEGFTLSKFLHQPSIKFGLKLFTKLQQYQMNYAYGYFVNVNSVAMNMVYALKPIMGSMMERTNVYGTRKSLWIPMLLKQIDGDQLPAWYGGENNNFKPMKVFG